MNPRTATLATIALLAPLALTAAPASAEDLRVAIVERGPDVTRSRGQIY